MDLYQAILSRHSVRRYQDRPLSSDALAQIDECVSQVVPLVPANHLRVMRRDALTGEDLIAAMGGYGRILSPPHYMIAAMTGKAHLLTDLGFRTEQVAVRMTQMGISSCFIGCLDRESTVRIRFRLPREARMGAFLIFGYAAETVTGRTINAVVRRMAGSNTKLPHASLFFERSFSTGTEPPRHLVKLIDAARLAPSANNAQPWRFLHYEDALYVFLRRQNVRYGNKESVQEYRYFDGGTCMANIALAIDALGYEGYWTLLDARDPAIPEHPADLEPLARLTLTAF